MYVRNDTIYQEYNWKIINIMLCLNDVDKKKDDDDDEEEGDDNDILSDSTSTTSPTTSTKMPTVETQLPSQVIPAQALNQFMTS